MKQAIRWSCGFVIGSLAAGCASTTPTASKPSAPPPAQPEARKDAQSSYEPRSTPGEGQKLLARMAGQWSVVKTFYPRNGGDPGVTRGECTQKMIHEGRFLESDFVFHDKGGDSTGTGVIGFDPEGGKFTSFWVDSRSTRTSVRQSETPFDGKEIVLFSKSLGETTGPAARRSRTVSILKDGDRTLLHQQFSDSPDAPPRLVMQMEMTRQR